MHGILGVLLVMEDKSADVQDQRPVSPHQGCKGDFIPAADKSPEQIAVGQFVHVAPRGQLADMLNNFMQLSSSH